ncbi:hypothetical protein OAI45_00780 [Planktomarina temperata]|nr:hypothetical protein [Planktomarina temperata]
MTGMSNTLHSLKPTSRRPLHGLMVLLVEDSLTAGEAVRLMCITSGARLRRTDCMESARRHLKFIVRMWPLLTWACQMGMALS